MKRPTDRPSWGWVYGLDPGSEHHPVVPNPVDIEFAQLVKVTNPSEVLEILSEIEVVCREQPMVPDPYFEQYVRPLLASLHVVGTA